MQYSTIQAFTTCFAVSMQLYRPRNKTAHKALQRLFLRLHPLNRPRYQTDTSGYNTTCDTLEGIPAPERAAPIPDTTVTPNAAQVSAAAYYNKVYKRADHASPAGSRCFPRPAAGGLAPSNRRSSPAARGAAGGAEPLAATAAALFGLSPDSQ